LFSVSGAPIYDENGDFVLAVVVTRDVTEQWRLQQAREELLKREQFLREEAEKSNRLKDEFLAVLSHELRTPMNVIMGWSSVIANTSLDESTLQQAVEMIHRNSRLQMQLIEDLLDVSRIIAGNLRLDMQPVELDEIVGSAIESLRHNAAARSIEIECHSDLHDGDVVGDASRLQQVVWNLVSNAIKFSHDGGRVEVTLRREAEAVSIGVLDNGKGIPPEFLPHVFDRFRQADSSSTRRTSGLGLGLAIAQHLVELHGGTIEARSEGSDCGAEFIVRLPAPALQTAEEPKRASEPQASIANGERRNSQLSGVTVLLVDDDPDALQLISLMLERAGAKVLCASSATHALQRLNSEAAHLLVSDIGMPHMDGYALIETIRTGSDNSRTDIPAIALTAYAGSGDRERALTSGFNKHVTKPVEAKQLIAAAAELMTG
jgi:signal transduction histidine kinase/CheY-like chemotaxis protein